MTRVAVPEGIPRWFTVLMHLLRRRRCWKVGHEIRNPYGIGPCAHCGQVDDLEDYP